MLHLTFDDYLTYAGYVDSIASDLRAYKIAKMEEVLIFFDVRFVI